MRKNAHGFYALQSAGSGANLAGNGSHHGNVGGIEIDVVGHQKLARSHGAGAGGGMQAGTTQVRPTSRIVANRVPQPLELPAAHLFQVGPVGPRGRGFIKEHRHTEAPPDFQARLAGQQDALLQLDAGDGHKGNYVRGADARVDTLLAGQVDQFGGLACPAHRRFDHRGGLSGDGHYGAVVVRIHRPVEQAHPLHAHRGHNRLDPPGIPAL